MVEFEPEGDLQISEIVSGDVLARSGRVDVTAAAAAWADIAAGGGAVPTDGATTEWFTNLVDSGVAELVDEGADPDIRELIVKVASAGYAWGRVVVDTGGDRLSWSDQLDEWVTIDRRVAAIDVSNWDLHTPGLGEVSRGCVDWVDAQVQAWGLEASQLPVVEGGALITFDEAVVGAIVEADLAAGS